MRFESTCEGFNSLDCSNSKFLLVLDENIEMFIRDCSCRSIKFYERKEFGSV